MFTSVSMHTKAAVEIAQCAQFIMFNKSQKCE